MTLSATRAKALSDPGRYSDGGGPHLFITKAGRKTWGLCITLDGYRLDIGLGEFPSVKLARPREKAPEFRDAIAEYKNPMSERLASTMPTFGEAAYAVNMTNRL